TAGDEEDDVALPKSQLTGEVVLPLVPVLLLLDLDISNVTEW
ncbi:hypothetical protein A2U01_0057211, partial [Trifolium medium]|nr:hypothetical protein [Trifolium medium]